MEKLTVIKIGGKVIDDPSCLNQFLSNFSTVQGHKLLVHGGGKVASGFGERLGIEPDYIDGRRITDAETLELVTMVYGGLVNKNIVAGLQAHGQNAIGLSGADGNVLKAVKRPVKDIDYGFVGDVDASQVHVKLLSELLFSGLSPVICPLTHDGHGSLLNTNADTMGSIMAVALSSVFEVQLVYAFEQKGVLSDFKNQTVIPRINSENYKKLKEDGIIVDGMIPKMDNAFDALRAGVEKVVIGHFSEIIALSEDDSAGTTITL